MEGTLETTQKFERYPWQNLMVWAWEMEFYSPSRKWHQVQWPKVSRLCFFSKAEFYDTNNKALEIGISNGLIQMNRNPTEAAMEIAQQTLPPEEELTSLPLTSTEEKDDLIPEPTPPGTVLISIKSERSSRSI
jgi:hypothetical protein